MPIIRCVIQLEEAGAGVLASFLQSIAEDESGRVVYSLAPNTTDQAIPISTTTGIETIDVFFITANKQISWRRVATDLANTLDANRPHLLFGTNITAILASNANTEAALVEIFVAGT